MAVDARVVISTAVLGLVVAVLYVYFAFFSKASRKAAGPPVVIIAGPSSSGKTALFQLWSDPEEAPKPTVLSVKPNQSPSFSAVPGVGLIDLPGHEKLQQFTNDALTHSNVKAVVYMVDASSGVAGVEAAAQRLFTILEVAEQKQIPVLIAANKFDLFNTLSLRKTTAVLEEALTSIRDTKSHTVPASEEEDSAWQEQERAFLGLDGKPFQFKDLETEVAVLEGSVKSRRTSKWEDWLQEIQR